jgi:hypothetical protein
MISKLAPFSQLNAGVALIRVEQFQALEFCHLGFQHPSKRNKCASLTVVAGLAGFVQPKKTYGLFPV